jgi:adenosylcobinamide hydrolase
VKVNLPIRGVHLEIDSDAVRVWSDAPLAVLSSAVIGGELRQTSHIVNMHVGNAYDHARPNEDLAAFAARCGIDEVFVGMMTAASTHNAGVAMDSREDLTVAAIVTAGLSNVASAGVTLPAQTSNGTINTILLVDGALSIAAMANAIITATEAKTMTLFDNDIRTPDGRLASGTSTDSIVVAHTGRGIMLEYTGPATTVGWLIGRAVRQALSESLKKRQMEAR